MVIHDSGYPSNKNLRYLEPTIEPNTSTIDTITLRVWEHTNFLFQPFTQLRAGLVKGSDSIRHILNFTSSGDVCFGPDIDVFFENNALFNYQAGKLNFLGKNSCLGFGKGAKLVVGNNTTLNYGKGGLGMLNLKTGGTIEIGLNSELVIENTLILNEYKNEKIPQQIYMKLNKGSKLTFAEGSHLINDFSLDGSIKLNIFMNGGDLDTKGLPVSERQLINLIYPDKKILIDEELKIYSRPQSNSLYIHFNGLNESEGFLKIMDTNGKQLKLTKVSINTGKNYWKLPIKDYSKGVYFISLYYNNKIKSKRFLKL